MRAADSSFLGGSELPPTPFKQCQLNVYIVFSPKLEDVLEYMALIRELILEFDATIVELYPSIQSGAYHLDMCLDLPEESRQDLINELDEYLRAVDPMASVVYTK